MLGLPDHYEFSAEKGYSYHVSIISDEGINRFASPILFKLFGNKLFAIARQPDEMMNREFKFAIQKKRKSEEKGKPINEDDPIDIETPDGKPATLWTPKSDKEFNMENFLDGYFPCIGFKRLRKDDNFKP
jgi:hypothetical protein